MYRIAMLITVLSFLACKATENRPVAVPDGFDWQGHRGCRGLKPENSLPAFMHALEFPEVTTLELDLAVSKDGKLIVSHEPFFNPAICLQADGSRFTDSTSMKMPLLKLTADEIRQFDCGSMGNPRFPEQDKIRVFKPTFREVVAAVRAVRPSVRWNIEIKSQPSWDNIFHPAIEEFAALLISELKEYGITDFVTVQSFDIRALEAMHRLAPEIRLAYLIENMDSIERNLKKLSFVPDIYSPYYLTVGHRAVQTCRKHNMKLIPWTVNEVTAMRRLVRLGVDGIITDYPDRIRSVYQP
jgi:glycerophosphoryl diester phosphodiesterase